MRSRRRFVHDFFAAIARTGSAPGLMVVAPAVPVKSVAELVEYMKARPGKLFYASAGTGTPSHLAMELLKIMTGTDAVHVPYKGMAPGLTDVMSGQVQISIPSIPGAVQLARAGKNIERALLGIALAKQRLAGLRVADLGLLGQGREVVILETVDRRKCLELSAVDLLRHQGLGARSKYAEKSLAAESLAQRLRAPVPTVSRAVTELLPSLARCEARPKTPREVREPRDDVVDAARSRIAKRTARERCKARSEDNTGVYQVAVGGDSFVQTGDCFVDQWQQ